MQSLCDQLEVLRSAAGNRGIHVNSGYRTPTYNAQIGGVSNSQHLYAKASDISVSGMSPGQVANLIEDLIRQGRMRQGGLGRYSTFTHYDIRGTAARW